MKSIFVLAISLLSTQILFAQRTDYCKTKGFVGYEFNTYYPVLESYNSANVENFPGFGINASFAKFHFGAINFSHQLGMNWGYKDYKDAISDITFEGGYMGGFEARSSRMSIYTTSSIGLQEGDVFELNVSGGFTTRRTKSTGFYYIYPNQEINEEDLVSEEEAEEANEYLVGKKWNLGLRTSAELTIIPNFMVAPFIRISYQQFGKRDVYDASTAAIDSYSGHPYMQSTLVNNTSDWGVAVGIKINFLDDECYPEMNFDFDNDTEDDDDTDYYDNSNNNSYSPSTNNNASSGGGVVLKPRVRVPK
jgi:hypothetical protein